MEVRLSSTNGKECMGDLEIRSWSKPERTRRGLKILGICWGAAILSVILPIAHFVLVPGFLLAGPIAAFFVSAQEASILGSKCFCPSCGQPFPVAKVQPRWPLNDVCSGCHEAIRIMPV